MSSKTSERGAIGEGWASGGISPEDPAATGWATSGLYMGIEGTNLRASFFSAYHAPSDMVEVEFSIVDPANDMEPINLSEIQKVEFYLLKNNNIIQSATDLDKFFGNEDFSFRCFFLHPSSDRNLEVRVYAETRDTLIDLRRPVLLAPVTPAENDVADNAAAVYENT